jgi:hypothetical protein
LRIVFISQRVLAASGFAMTSTVTTPHPHRAEVILELGAEGGSLTLVGTKAAHGWRFRMIRDESTLRDLLSEEDCEGLELQSESSWVDSWEAALALFDKYPWHLLYPLRVHPHFVTQIWAAVRECLRNDPRSEQHHELERWRRLLWRSVSGDQEVDPV